MSKDCILHHVSALPEYTIVTTFYAFPVHVTSLNIATSSGNQMLRPVVPHVSPQLYLMGPGFSLPRIGFIIIAGNIGFTMGKVVL
jgi:hypothetical protein